MDTQKIVIYKLFLPYKYASFPQTWWQLNDTVCFINPVHSNLFFWQIFNLFLYCKEE